MQRYRHQGDPRFRKPPAGILGNRLEKGTKLLRIKDGAEFIVAEDNGGPLRFVGYPNSSFDRTYFKRAK